MSRYDFTSLSSQDFEELARDLLQAEWNVSLEAFRSGRDNGIDLRYAPGPGEATIIQCKHYVGSGFRKLLSHLRDTERPKIEALAPHRYVVVTSVPLSPSNKDDIIAALAPYVRATGDVFGAHDLEGLLSRHPDIERANFKLWLTNTEVIERVLYNAELCQTEFEVQRIQRDLPLFVQNDAFPRAEALLDQTRVAIISGVPGIGKTTLAEMLLYSHLERGYEPVVFKSEIAEARRLFRRDRRQIFFYDDFLGQIFLGDRKEYFGRNEDAAIVDFMEMIGRSEHSRFILTTREHLLQSALRLSERLDQSRVLDHQCILELKDYSYAQKARILYNHLYFSNLPQDYKDAILQDRFFLSVIKHDHFNPRLIEWLSSYARLRQVSAEQYRSHISHLLDNPHDIWKHAYLNQISAGARDVLVCLYTLDGRADIKALERIFSAFQSHVASKYNRRFAPGEFHNALQVLDGAFLTYGFGRALFINPSIREFVGSVIRSDRHLAEDLLSSAVRFRQLINLWRLGQAYPDSELADLLRSNTSLFAVTARRLLSAPTVHREPMGNGMIRYGPVDTGREARVEFLAQAAEAARSRELTAIAANAADALIASWDQEVPEFIDVLDLLEELQVQTWFLQNGGSEIYRSLLDGVLENAEYARAVDWTRLLTFPEKAHGWTEDDDILLNKGLDKYRSSGIDDEISDCSDRSEYSELRDYLDELGKEFGLDFLTAIERIDDDIASLDESQPEYDEGEGLLRSSGRSGEDRTSDEDVTQMFETLRESS